MKTDPVSEITVATVRALLVRPVAFHPVLARISERDRLPNHQIDREMFIRNPELIEQCNQMIQDPIVVNGRRAAPS